MPHLQEAPCHGMELAESTWGHVFNEAEREALSRMLVEPEDWIELRGGAFLRALYGGLVFERDTTTDTVYGVAEMMSDKDLYAPRELITRVAELTDKAHVTTTHALSRISGESNLDISSTEHLLEEHLIAIDEALTWIDKSTALGADRKDYYRAKFESARQEMRDAPQEDVLSLCNFFVHEGMSLRISKQSDGELVGAVWDPKNCLAKSAMEDRDNYWQMRSATPPFVLDISDSVYNPYLELLCELAPHENVIFESSMPQWLLKTQARALKLSTELLMPLDTDDAYDGRLRFVHKLIDLQGLAASGNIAPADSLMNKLQAKYGDITYADYLKMYNQSILGRTLLEHPEYETLQIAFMELQLDAYLSEDIQMQLEFFHAAYQSEDVITMDDSDSVNDLLEEYVNLNDPFAITDFKTRYNDHLPALRFMHICKSRYPKEAYRSFDPTNGEALEYSHEHHQNTPRAMSEMLAVIAYSFGIDKEPEALDRLINSWVAKGSITRSWKATREALDLEVDATRMKAELEKVHLEFDDLLSPTF